MTPSGTDQPIAHIWTLQLLSLMKKILLIACICALPLTVSARAENWAFVHSAGGMSINVPFHSEHGWSLPIRANVSGLESISNRATALNSALICERTDAAVVGSSIYLTIITSTAQHGDTSLC